MSERVVHMASLADIDNFGDLLFPLLAAHRLAPFGFEVAALSPTGRRSRFPDAPPSMAIADALAAPPASAGLLVGGGNLAIGAPTSRYECLVVEFWLAASFLAVCEGWPIAWNVPGVPRSFPARGLGLLARRAMDAADHLAVRDEPSRAFLASATEREIAIFPDSAIDTAAMWPAATLEPRFAALLARKNAAAGPFLAVHVRGEDDVTAIAPSLAAGAAALGLTPLLVAIGPGAGDDVALRRLAAALPSAILLDDPQSLAEIAAALAMSAAYVGQSLHGAIVAASYGVPGVLVAPPPARRFRGFLASRSMPEALVPDFAEGMGRLASLPRRAPLPTAMHEALDVHWEGVRCALAGPPRATAARLAFLQEVARTGTRFGGADWAALPFRVQTHKGKAISRSSG